MRRQHYNLLMGKVHYFDPLFCSFTVERGPDT